MDPNKAPGPDGFNPGFYQLCWNFVGRDVAAACRGWMTMGIFPPRVSQTNIVLLPKVDDPGNMRDLRPISLSNVVYQIVAKVFANRLKRLMPAIVSEEQSAFVKGRLITDNVMIACEMLHCMKRRQRAKDGEVALKIDISKAFDRVEWSYLSAILLKLGFSERWINPILMCVTGAEYRVLVNNTETEQVIPSRGLRQGCPLSPFLFILCAEGLTALIKKSVRDGQVHGVRVCRGAPYVSHLLFADDSYFFFRAEIGEASTMKHIFDTYALASGQLFNYSKLGIIFNASTHGLLKEAVCNILGVTNTTNGDRYLGVPPVVGRKKKQIFAFIRDRVWDRLKSLASGQISAGGREVLIKAVAQAIPTYCMNVHLLPTTLLDEIEKMMNSYWWGMKSGGGRGISWMR
ncbi:LINE-1 retrotransposable element ORF2 protein [Linum perenne]